MKRKIFGIAVLGLSMLTLSSCILKNKDLSVNRDLTYTYTEENWSDLKSQMTRFEDALSGKSVTDIVGSWNKINRDTYALATYRAIEYVNYASTGDNTSYNKYLDFQDKIVEVSKWMESMYQPMYESKWSTSFFQGMTEEEIQRLLSSKMTDRFYELEAENEKLIKQYQDLASSEVNEKAPQIYLSLVKNYKEQAKEAKYDTYLDYAYDRVYTREYKPSEVEDFNANVKNYIVPLLEKTIAKLEKETMGMTTYSQQQATDFLSKYFESNRTIIDDYATYMGGDYEKNYNKLWNEGYLKLGSGDKAIKGAYTTYLYIDELDQPIMYFGPGYQNTLTLVHEFGHYNAFTINGAKEEMSYDLAEIQSQGNEMVFISWLKNQNKLESSSLEYIADNQIYDACSSIVLSSIINEFENTVYSTDGLYVTDFDAMYKKAFEKFGGYDYIMSMIYGNGYETAGITDYWKRVCLENPGYYISYAMSAVPTLEIYALCQEDLEKGTRAYKACYQYSEVYSQKDFLAVIKAAGLGNPFESESYDSISKIC